MAQLAGHSYALDRAATEAQSGTGGFHDRTGATNDIDGSVHPQIAWAKLRAVRDDRPIEREVVESNSKVPVQDGTKQSKKV